MLILHLDYGFIDTPLVFERCGACRNKAILWENDTGECHEGRPWWDYKWCADCAPTAMIDHRGG